MRNTIKLLLGLVLVLAPLSIGAISDGIREVELQTGTPAGTGFRTPSTEDLECYQMVLPE